MNIPPDSLVQSFLRRAREDGVAALVVYAARSPDGKIPTRVASNSDEKGTRGALAWLNKMDAAAIEAACRALHTEHCIVCGADDIIKVWEDLAHALQKLHADVVRRVLEATREASGKTLNITKLEDVQ